MGATSILLFLALCLAEKSTGDTGSGFPSKKIASIAKSLPTHSIVYVEREMILSPSDVDDPPILQLLLLPVKQYTDLPLSEIPNTELPDTELPQDEDVSEEEKMARLFATVYNRIMDNDRAIAMKASWNYMTNITAENNDIFTGLIAEMGAAMQERIPIILSFNYTTFKDPLLRRQFKYFSYIGDSALPAEKLHRLTRTIKKMTQNYGTVRICSYQDPAKCDLQIEPELTRIMEQSEDPEELKYYWQEWYDKAGTPMRATFDEYVELKNEAARLNNFSSAADAWISNYEDRTIEKQFENIFFHTRPFFEELHAFVRHALNARYGEKLVPFDEPIPMHLLGNMWGQHWLHVEDFTTPFPDARLPDITAEMRRQNYTVLDIYKMAEKFFTSMGLPEMSEEFWENSIFEKPQDRDIVCQASAWDMSNGTDFRIKQCTHVNMQDMLTVHHEMGHIEYCMLYREQPSVFRTSGNDGFHEAFGDTIALSVNTPKYWQRLGLVDSIEINNYTKINQLFRMALDKIPEIQFIYALELFRYSVFRDRVEPDHYNCEYWERMLRILGVKPPVQRYMEDFDPPAKYHVAADVEFARYLVSTTLQFQFHKGLCLAAGEYEPDTPGKLLSDCSLFGSKAAGDILKKVLSLGSSVPWPDQLEMISGTRKLDASALLEYFQPLYAFLLRFNRENGVHVGWNVHSECLHRDSDDTTTEAD